MDELVAGADAVGREAVSEVCRAVLGTPPALATLGYLQALGPLRLVLAPFPTPFEVLYRYCSVSFCIAGFAMQLSIGPLSYKAHQM